MLYFGRAFNTARSSHTHLVVTLVGIKLAFLVFAYTNLLHAQVKGVEQELDAENEDPALSSQME